MQLTKRQSDLLFSAVQEYILTGEPAASDELRTRYHLPYSPATIRAELSALSDEGLLVQPHTSAGRIPTDTGYRWYAERVKASPRLDRQEAKLVHDLADQLSDPSEFFHSLSETFARIAEALVVAGEVENEPEPMYKAGFRETLALPEFTDLRFRDGFGELVDSIDSDIRSWILGADFREPKTFIGRDIPIAGADDCGMMIKTFGDSKQFTPTPQKPSGFEAWGFAGVVAIIGPKRMRYDKGFSLLYEVERFFD